MNRKNKAWHIRAVVFLTLLAILSTVLIIPALATGSSGKTEISAELTPAKGGATSIATMTFDDGLVETANKLNELCAQYGTKATLVLVSRNYVKFDDSNKITYNTTSGGTSTYYIGTPSGINTTSVETMKEILSHGYLDITSHSRNHIILSDKEINNLYPQITGYTAEKLMENEMKGSIDDLKLAFPDYEVLTYGVPSSSLASGAYSTLYANYYAARSGSCVLLYQKGKMQSIDPPTGNALGSWYYPYGIRLMQEKEQYQADIDINKILAYLDTCVENNGWFLSMAHGIVPSENYDCSVEDLSTLMAAMQKYQKSGKLWVATYNEATKYIRERQNSTVSAYTEGGKYFVSVAMSDKTEDKLPLPVATFNMPLTVKVEVPREWARVSYTLNGSSVSSKCFSVGAKNYAYVDVVPNSGDIEFTDGTLPEDGADFVPGRYTLPEGAWDHKSAENLASYPNILYGIWESEADFLAGKAPVVWRSSDSSAANYAEGVEANFIGAADSNGARYYTFTNENGIASSATGNGAALYTRYVHVYQNTKMVLGTASTTQLVTAQRENLIIDLGGNSFDMYGVRVGGVDGSHPDASFTLKNGYANYLNYQTQPRRDTTLIYDNIDLTMSHKLTFVYDGGAKLIEYRNSVIRAKNENCFNVGRGAGTINFINTDIIYETAPSTYFMDIYETADSKNSSLTVTFDENCTITNIPQDKWFKINEVYSTSSEAYGRFGVTQIINFELGVQFAGASAHPNGYTFADIDYAASVAAGGAVYNNSFCPCDFTVGGVQVADIRHVEPVSGGAVTDYWKLYDEEAGSYELIKDLTGYEMAKLDEANRVILAAWGDRGAVGVYASDIESLVMLNPETGERLDKSDFYFLRNSSTEPFYIKSEADLSNYGIIDIDPETNIIYQTWAKGSVSAELTSSIAPDANNRIALDVRDGAYLLFLQDVTAGNVHTAAGKDVTFDLNGHKFTTSAVMQLGLDGSTNLKRDIRFISTADTRGTLALSNYLQARPGTNLYFENLDITFGGNYLVFDNTCSVIYMKDCLLTGNENYAFQTYGAQNPVEKLRVFDNVTFSKVGIYQVACSIGNENIQFNFINGCVVDTDTENGMPLINVYKSGTNATTLTASRVFNIEKSTKFTGGLGSIKLDSGYENHASTITTNYYDNIDASIKPGAYSATAAADKLSVTLGNKLEDDAFTLTPVYSSYNSTTVAYNILYTDDKALPGYNIPGYRITTAAGVGTIYLAGLNSAGEAIITLAEIKAIPEGGTILFLSDIKYDPTGNTDEIKRIKSYKNNITVDLGGHTFTLNYRWQLDKTRLSFKNGNIVADEPAPANTTAMFYGAPTADAVITFTDVNVSVINNNGSAAYPFISVYNGTYKITGGSINVPGTCAINFNSTKDHTLIMDGVTVNTHTMVQKAYYSGTQNYWSINNCDITVTDCMFNINNGSYSGSGDYVNVSITGSKIDGNIFRGKSTVTKPLFNFTLSDTFFTVKPEVVTGCSIAYGTGKALITIDTALNDGFSYIAGSKPELGTNLTLFTDFNLNLFAGENILGIYRDGAPLSSMLWEGKDKYTITFPAHAAADTVALEVLVQSGNVTYKLPLNCSVLEYAKKLIASDKSEESKTLAKAAVAYINEAYLVKGNAVPAALTEFVTNNTVVRSSAVGTLGGLTDAVAGAQFYLDSGANLVLNLAANCNGTVKVNGTSYEVKNGVLSDGSTCIKINLKVKNLMKPVTVEYNGASADFTLAGYVNSASVQGSNYKALVEALYTYAYYANAYANSEAGAELN